MYSLMKVPPVSVPRWFASCILAGVIAGSPTSPVRGEDYEWVGNYLDDADLIPDSAPYWSYYEGGFWLGLKVPGLEYTLDPDDNADDDAIFGSQYDTPQMGAPFHLQRGGTLYFGDFTHRLNSSISPYAYYEARDLVNRSLDVQSGKWTFDFGSFGDRPGLLAAGDGQQGSYRLTDFVFVGDKVKHSYNGAAPGNAELTLRNGTLSAGRVALGVYPGAEGKLIVEDAGNLVVANEAGFGDLHVGDFGVGRLVVRQGSVVDVAGETVIGRRDDSVGGAVISGARSTLDTRGVAVGGGGFGRMTIAQGGLVTTNGAWNFIGVADGAVGRVTVTGPGSTWTDMFRLTVGGVYHTDTSGRGSLTIADGGFVSNREASVGNRSRSRGDVTVTGENSVWDAGFLMLGDDGRGALTIADGGLVTTSDALIGHAVNGVGKASVQWRGRLEAANDLIVGNEGRGTLDVNRGGVVTVGRMLRIGSLGEMNVDPRGVVNVGAGPLPDPEDSGILRVGPGGILGGKGVVNANVFVDGGTVAPGQSPGVLTINGNFVHGPGSTLAMEIGGTTAGVQYDQLLVSGDLALGGDVDVRFIDGFVPKRGDRFDLFGGSATSFTGRLNFIDAPANLQFASSLCGGRFSLAVVPEPTTLALGAVGLIVTLAGSRRRSSGARLTRGLVKFVLLISSMAVAVSANRAPAATISPPTPWPEYSVIPVLFSPTDWDVNSQEVQREAAAIRSAMENIQQFYAQNLGGRTFRLNDLEVVQGYGAKEDYHIIWNGKNIYEDGVQFDGNMEHAVVSELYSRGYPTPPGQNVDGYSVLMFVKGAGGWAGAREFSQADGGWGILGDFCIDSLEGDVPEGEYWWSGRNQQIGAAGHELGHTFGLPHPDANDGNWESTVMGHWWGYPNLGLNQWEIDRVIENKSAFFVPEPPTAMLGLTGLVASLIGRVGSSVLFTAKSELGRRRSVVAGLARTTGQNLLAGSQQCR